MPTKTLAGHAKASEPEGLLLEIAALYSELIGVASRYRCLTILHSVLFNFLSRQSLVSDSS